MCALHCPSQSLSGIKKPQAADIQFNAWKVMTKSRHLFSFREGIDSYTTALRSYGSKLWPQAPTMISLHALRSGSEILFISNQFNPVGKA